jgi:hypothetical protein
MNADSKEAVLQQDFIDQMIAGGWEPGNLLYTIANWLFTLMVVCTVSNGSSLEFTHDL